MRSKRQQTIAKREREQAVREKRQRKIQKKLDRAAGLLDEPVPRTRRSLRARSRPTASLRSRAKAPVEGEAQVESSPAP